MHLRSTFCSWRHLRVYAALDAPVSTHELLLRVSFTQDGVWVVGWGVGCTFCSAPSLAVHGHSPLGGAHASQPLW